MNQDYFLKSSRVNFLSSKLKEEDLDFILHLAPFESALGRYASVDRNYNSVGR